MHPIQKLMSGLNQLSIILPIINFGIMLARRFVRRVLTPIFTFWLIYSLAVVLFVDACVLTEPTTRELGVQVPLHPFQDGTIQHDILKQGVRKSPDHLTKDIFDAVETLEKFHEY